MAKFKVGDRVKLAVDRFAIPRGTTGVIKSFGKDADKEKLDSVEVTRTYYPEVEVEEDKNKED